MRITSNVMRVFLVLGACLFLVVAYAREIIDFSDPKSLAVIFVLIAPLVVFWLVLPFDLIRTGWGTFGLIDAINKNPETRRGFWLRMVVALALLSAVILVAYVFSR